MFSWYKYLIVSLVFSFLDFWSGNTFLIAPFPDLCLLVPFSAEKQNKNNLSVKTLNGLNIFSQNIDFGYTSEPPRSVFLSKNKK